MQWRELFEARQSSLDSCQEGLLFHARGLEQVLRASAQFREHVAHRVDHRLHHVHQSRLAAAEQVCVAHGAAKDAAQYVTASLVARKYSVGEQERHGARVIRNHAEGCRVNGILDHVRTVTCAGDPYARAMFSGLTPPVGKAHC
jgi:hypothetical protein